MNICYSALTSIPEIQSMVAIFNIPREQFFELSHPPALNPIHIGTLTGLLKAMTTSNDFKAMMKDVE